MNAQESLPAARFLCASADASRTAWLQEALGPLGSVQAAPCESAALVSRIAEHAPSIVFVDFTSRTLAHANDASALAQAARDAFPAVPIVALGTLSSPVSAVVALRAGVRDFVDLNGEAGDVLSVVRRLLDERPELVSRHGRITVLVGARTGMGVSTLAANLAHAVHQRGAARHRTTALLDLGLPAADSALLLDTQSELHFVDAVRSLRRIDETFVNTAFARHPSGLAITALPADLSSMRAISFASAVSTLNRLRAFFDHQIVDLGGFSNLDFVAQVLQAADIVWLVCDPNVTSAVSARAFIEGLHADASDAPAPVLGLVVNKFDAALNFGADQLAARLELPLVAVLPERAQALGRAVNQGLLLSACAERDPYVRALAPLVTRLCGDETASKNQTRAQRLGHFLPTLLKRS